MSSKGYITIPESQLRIERNKKMKNRTWHNNIMNLLLGKNVCGACLRLENDLIHWDAEFVVVRCEYDIESSLKNIMISTFGLGVTTIIPTPLFCQNCVDTILSSHLLILQLRENCKNIQLKLIEITKQMEWTAYLDETGSLTETMLSNKVQEDIDMIQEAADDFINLNDSIEGDIKTHKIIIDNESLKSLLLKDADMHQYLFKKVKLTEPKLPAGITVKKVEKNVDMSDFAPQDLLELNWAEDEVDAEPSNKLQSNEALIMNLMEEAKTGEKHKHFQDNLKVRTSLPEPEVLHDSLSVKLIQNQTSETPEETQGENDSGADDLVPQDLLELKWPDEPSTEQTKIPVKKLNFNESLTVKFIPAHKLVRVNNSANESLNLPELNWNEEEENYTTETGHTHSIDLTQWLHDQGMRTIKAKNFTPENSASQDFDIEAHITKTVKLQKKKDPVNSGTGIVTRKCNIAVENLDVLNDPDSNAKMIRCGLCDLSFVLFESYHSHYKTHKISETAKCYRCTGKFPVIELLVEHLLLVHSEDMTYCTLCYALMSQDKLAQHMVDHHAQKVEIINAHNMPLITKDGRCKKCNRKAEDYPDHICVFNIDCTECKTVCMHQKYLQSYINQIKDNKAVYKCTDCEYLYKTKQDIIKHANFMHLQHKSHQCVVCQLKFSTQNELSKHNFSFHFTCGRCKKVFSEKDNLYMHNCPKPLHEYFTCEACGQRFTNMKCNNKHKETALAVSDECVICHDFVSNKCNMSRHMQVKHQVYLKKEDDTILFECTICQKNFNSETDFKLHACLYDCKICERRFINKVLHERHLKAHSGEKRVKQIKCDVCNLQLPDKYAFTNHMLTHTSYGKCPICLTYLKKSVLKHHIESHGGTKDSLKCPYCVLICENRNQFEVHVNRFHLMCRPYQCDICSKAFYGKIRLTEHIKEHAFQRRRAKCPVCGKRFAKKVTMEKHLKLHSTGQLYNCDLCEKMYISAALLQQHRKCHAEIDELSKPETSQSSQM